MALPLQKKGRSFSTRKQGPTLEGLFLVLKVPRRFEKSSMLFFSLYPFFCKGYCVLCAARDNNCARGKRLSSIMGNVCDCKGLNDGSIPSSAFIKNLHYCFFKKEYLLCYPSSCFLSLLSCLLQAC